MNQQHVILVNESDEVLGTMEKMEAHEKGLLHRAFSVFIFNSKGQMLLQQRSAHKYHGALLWSNACCSHPYLDEDVETAAQRRLMEELGFGIPLQKLFCFTYKAEVENGLMEHEYDHVFAGEYEGPFNINSMEVAAVRYDAIADIKYALQTEPANFTTWFHIAFPLIEQWWMEQYNKTKISEDIQ